MYSGISLGVAIVRKLHSHAALEMGFRTESREIEGPETLQIDNRLGSIEVIPLTLLIHYYPFKHFAHTINPYLGGGAAYTFIWEKSGKLDGDDLPPSFDPALQTGFTWDLKHRLFLTLDITWNTLSLEIEGFDETDPTFNIDPMTFAIGIGTSF